MSEQVKKALVPVLRFPEFWGEREWEITELGKVASSTTGESNREDSTSVGKYAFFDRSDEIRASSRYLFDTEAIIVAGEGQEFIPKYFVGKFDLHQRAYATLDFRENIIGKYVFYWIYQNRKHFNKVAVGSTVPSLRLPMFTSFPIKLPPSSDEQQKIADCLSSLDELITLQTQKRDTLKEHKKGLMQQLFPAIGKTQPKLRFPEFRGEWELVAFDEMIGVIDGDRGKNYPKSEDFSETGFCMFLNAKNVTKNGFKFNKMQFISKEKDTVLRKGKLALNDVVLTTRGSVGQFAYYSESIPYENLRINSGMVLLRAKTKQLLPEFLYAFSKSSPLTMHIENIAFGNAQQQLTVAEIKKFTLCFPKPDEQQKIADCLSSLDALITAQTQKIDTLKSHKKGLMQQLFPSMDKVGA